MENDRQDRQDRQDGQDGNFLNNIFGSMVRDASISLEAAQNDKRIENAVVYKLTKGYTHTPKQASLDNFLGENVNIDQLQDIMGAKLKFQEEVAVMFKEFKSAILRKSITLDELEHKVYSEYGVVNPEWYDKAHPLEADGFVFEEMSEEDYKIMRESYDGEETSNPAE